MMDITYWGNHKLIRLGGVAYDGPDEGHPDGSVKELEEIYFD